MSDTSQRIHRKESVVLRGFLYAVQFISLGCLLGKKDIEQGNAGRYNGRTNRTNVLNFFSTSLYI